MTILHTTNYGIAYIDTTTTLDQLAQASQDAATTIDAALGRGGVAPFDASSLAAEVAARQAADTALGNRVSALETTSPVSPALTSSWAPYSVQGTGADFQSLRMWKVGPTVFASGFIKAAAALGVTDTLITTIPAGFRPPSVATRVPSYALAGTVPQRLDAYADGRLQVSLTQSMAIGATLAISAHWSLA